jgi:hypothetical protein
MFEDLEDSGTKAGQALADFAGEGLNNASKSEFEALKQDLQSAIKTDEKGNKTLTDAGAFSYV